ncbi:MAG: hypothetical protein ACXABY_18590 [Candidatus Thorarchaeota archaeon]|jgi:hypothetical protein
MRWKIYYDDGTTFSNEEGTPESAPLDGVLCIVEKQDQVQVYYGFDFYYWTGENWAAGYQAALERWLRGVLPDLKYGRWTRTSIYKQAMKAAETWQ